MKLILNKYIRVLSLSYFLEKKLNRDKLALKDFSLKNYFRKILMFSSSNLQLTSLKRPHNVTYSIKISKKFSLFVLSFQHFIKNFLLVTRLIDVFLNKRLNIYFFLDRSSFFLSKLLNFKLKSTFLLKLNSFFSKKSYKFRFRRICKKLKKVKIKCMFFLNFFIKTNMSSLIRRCKILTVGFSSFYSYRYKYIYKIFIPTFSFNVISSYLYIVYSMVLSSLTKLKFIKLSKFKQIQLISKNL